MTAGSLLVYSCSNVAHIMADHREIKARARREDKHIADLIALAPKNDPFYSGTPKDVESAGWFGRLWKRFGYSAGIHIRRVHYQILSQDPPVLMPDETPYENTERCWRFINAASKAARYLGEVDPAAFVDRRNPDPILWAKPDTHAHVSVLADDEQSEFGLPEFPPLPSYELKDFEGRQRYLVEVWCEKSTMNDVLLPLCEQYGANLVTGVGELSITAVLHLVSDRIAAMHKPTRILYVSDFDPAGMSMPVAVARKIEYFVREKQLHENIQLRPVVLTLDQVRDYRLPRTPIKESEGRKAHFEEHYGSGATELDALEALHPGVLHEILEAEILRYYDADLVARADDARASLQERLSTIEGDSRAELADEIGPLEDEYRELRDAFAGRIADWHERMRSVQARLAARLHEHKPDLKDFPAPEGRRADDPDWVLYDSGLDYDEQLARYKEFQQGTSTDA